MKLKRLTGLERDKIESELNDLLKLIDELKAILSSPQKIDEIIKNEMLEIKNKYADERRTNIDMTAIDYIDDESLIPEENIMVVLTKKVILRELNQMYLGLKIVAEWELKVLLQTMKTSLIRHVIYLLTIIFYSLLIRVRYTE